VVELKKAPDPIDRHVGSRVRMQRTLMKMSQEKLGEALGITFQQVQKYEKGTNRIGASRLQQISKILKVPPSFFFEDAPGGPSAQSGGFAEESSSQYVVDFLSTSEGLHLNRAFARIRDPKVRKRVLDLVTTLAEQSEPSGK
jgi:transcriptional regulator with XRE-family HTH domain